MGSGLGGVEREAIVAEGIWELSTAFDVVAVWVAVWVALKVTDGVVNGVVDGVVVRPYDALHLRVEGAVVVEDVFEDVFEDVAPVKISSVVLLGGEEVPLLEGVRVVVGTSTREREMRETFIGII